MPSEPSAERNSTVTSPTANPASAARPEHEPRRRPPARRRRSAGAPRPRRSARRCQSVRSAPPVSTAPPAPFGSLACRRRAPRRGDRTSYSVSTTIDPPASRVAAFATAGIVGQSLPSCAGRVSRSPTPGGSPAAGRRIGNGSGSRPWTCTARQARSPATARTGAEVGKPSARSSREASVQVAVGGERRARSPAAPAGPPCRSAAPRRRSSRRARSRCAGRRPPRRRPAPAGRRGRPARPASRPGPPCGRSRGRG